MQLIISILFSLFLSLTPNLDFHKFYVSTTDIVYKSEKKSIQITTQLFIDDIERLLQVACTSCKISLPKLPLKPCIFFAGSLYFFKKVSIQEKEISSK